MQGVFYVGKSTQSLHIAKTESLHIFSILTLVFAQAAVLGGVPPLRENFD
jgi:hypothetical protein